MRSRGSGGATRRDPASARVMAVRVLAWNIAHQIRQRPIPADLPALFESMGADVVLLTEYVEQRPRLEFRQALQRHGYPHQLVSFTPAVHNQVFAASRSRSRKEIWSRRRWERG
jgi:hypothetical protein